MHEPVIIIAQYGILIPILGYVLLAYYQRKNLKQLLLLTFTAAVLSIVLIKIAGILHSDPRPFIRDGVTPYFSSATDNGFPSDHTALSSAIAAIVFVYNKPAGLGLFVVAAIIGTARVIGNVHHAQDVVGAFVITIISVTAAQFIRKKLNS